jgi:hypothetical protein
MTSHQPFRAIFLVTTFCLLIFASINIQAQRLCEAIVQDTLVRVENSCVNADNETACYGNDALEVTFTQEDATPDAFTSPADILALALVDTLQGTGIDLESDEWGIGYLQTRGTITNDAPADERLVILMMGAVSLESVGLENGVPSFNFLAQQGSECVEAPNTIVMQGPEDTAVEVRVNNIPVRIGSTVVFGFGKDDDGQDVLWTTTLAGNVTLYYDSDKALDITSGHYSYTYPTAPENSSAVTPANASWQMETTWGVPFVRRVPASDFIPPEPLRDSGDDFRSRPFYETVYNLPVSILNYPLAQETACTITPQTANNSGLSAHVGAGYERGIRAWLDISRTYTAVGENVDSVGERWYVLDDSEFGEVWVNAGEFLETCPTLPTVANPPVVLLPSATPNLVIIPTNAPLGVATPTLTPTPTETPTILPG